MLEVDKQEGGCSGTVQQRSLFKLQRFLCIIRLVFYTSLELNEGAIVLRSGGTPKDRKMGHDSSIGLLVLLKLEE